MISIESVNRKTSIKSAEFVKLTLSKTNGTTQILTFSNSYRPEVVEGLTYQPLGGLLGISQQQRSLEATQYDTSLTLSGVNQQNIFTVLSADNQIKGSKIQIYRGFYSNNYSFDELALRYTGIVVNFNINESVDNSGMKTEYVVGLNCANFKKILEDGIGGIATNSASWKRYFPNDVSMDRIDTLHDRSFDFGKKVAAPAPTQAEINQQNEWDTTQGGGA
jgi:hypothetical protein